MSRLRNRLRALETAAKGPGRVRVVILQPGEAEPSTEDLAARMPDGKRPRSHDLIVFVQRFALS